LATHFHRTGKYQKAVDLYRIVLRLRPNYALAYYNLGTILYGLGKTEMALRAYQQAMMRDSHYTTKLLDLTNKFYAQGKLEKAFKMYGAIIRLTPGSGAAHYSQGMLDYSQKRYHAALISFEQAVRHRQDDFNVYLGLAQTYEKLGRIQEAIRTYRHLLSFKPDNLQAKQRLQRLLSHQTAK